MKYLFVIIGLWFSFISCSQTTNVDSINVFETQDLILSNKSIIIIDGRNGSMFSEGHLPGAVNIDAFSDSVAIELEALDKTKTYLIYCTTNNRADALIELMGQKGFLNLYEMQEGITVWKQKGFEIETY